MLKYLIIQLCNSAPSFCHYDGNNNSIKKLIPIDVLKKGIRWALKNNLYIQYLWPSYTLPDEYLDMINAYEHVDIRPLSDGDKECICVATSLFDNEPIDNLNVIIRLSIKDVVQSTDILKDWLLRAKRLNLIIKDYKILDDNYKQLYRNCLMELADTIIESFKNGKNVSLNILTDRFMLHNMNNCNAGVESVTLAPDGNLYLCPAFYYEKDAIGTIEDGLSIKNSHLLTLQYAPICRICDAYHCKRCIWLNKSFTLEINTPGHEQCVASHIERNVSAYISRKLVSLGIISEDKQFNESEYLDPFYKLPRVRLK